MVLRIAAVVVSGVLIWTVAGARLASQQRLPLGAIVPGAVETLPFGCTSFELEPFDPFCPGLHIHTGVDLAAPAGTPVLSAAEGIAHAGFDPQRAGIFVVVSVDPHVRLLYCHLWRVHVTPGQVVTPGELIGEVGATGMATGAHLHFEVQVDGLAVDPAVWLAN